MPIKSSINPIFNVFERYQEVNLINPFRYDLKLKSVSLSTNQYLTITPVAGLETTPFTVCCWIKKSVASGVYSIANYMPKGAHADGRGFSIESNASNDRVFWGDADGSWAVVNGSAPTTNWKFILFNWVSPKGELFINNVSQGSVSDGISFTNHASAGDPNQKYFLIGAVYNSSITNYFNGNIAGFAIFNKELDSTEKAWIYNSGVLRDYSKASFFGNCKMYLPFNDSYDDYTGNGHNATAVNSPTFDSTIPQ